MKVITLTIDGKCAFCHSKGEYVNNSSDGTYGWRHSEPACDPFKNALKEVTNIRPLADGVGWEVIND